jgi:hypothetical protein
VDKKEAARGMRGDGINSCILGGLLSELCVVKIAADNGRIHFFLLCAVAMLLPPCGAMAQVRTKFEARDIQIPFYADSAQSPAAVLKIQTVFTDHRRLGFFRIKLLTVLVAQNVCVELTDSTSNTNWAAAFQFKRWPFARGHDILEWHDVSVRMPGETLPRLRAGRVSPNSNASTDFCLLEDVTLQTDRGQIKISQARLLLAGQPGRVVWEDRGRKNSWDLFTGNLNSNTNQTSTNSP